MQTPPPDPTHPLPDEGSRFSPTLLGQRTLLGVIGILLFIIAVGGGCWLRESMDNYVRVMEVIPEGEVAPGTNITVSFSKDLVPDSLVEVRLATAPVSFNPPLPGSFQWLAPDRLRFYPEVVLAPATEYTLEIESGITEGTSYAVQGPREFSFHTPRLRVSSAALNFEYTPGANTEARLVSTVEFNYPVDPQTAADYLTLRYKNGESIPYTIVSTEPGAILRLEAPRVRRDENEQAIELVVEEGLRPIGGSLGMAGAFVEPVLLPGQEDLKVLHLSPVYTGGTQGTVRIEFNIPVDPQTAANYITVEPTVDFQTTANHHYLTLRGDFQAGQSYRIALQDGLRAIDGSSLDRRFASTLTFLREDIPPQIDFAGNGFYLTRDGNLNLGLTTINVNDVIIEIDKVFANNIPYILNTTNLSYEDPYYYYDYYEGDRMEAVGTRLATFDLGVAAMPNEEVVTPIRLEQYLGTERLGIYKVTAREKERRWQSAARWVVATNIGLVSKTSGDDLWVWANNLQTLAPIIGAELTLISQNNQTLLTATTNTQGLAVFEDLSVQAEGFEPYVVTASFGDDLSFLELQRRQIPTSDFEVGGAPYLASGYDAYVYDERGIYRPGERVPMAAIVRGAQATVPPPFPVKLAVTGPDGRLFAEHRSLLNEQGTAEFSTPVPDYARTGSYTARLLVGDEQEIGRTRFSVEEFIPDRMKVTLTSDQETYLAGEQATIQVQAVTLFGPPASGRRVEATVELEPFPFAPNRWNGFTFSDPTNTFSMERIELDNATLDEDGEYTYTYSFPQDVAPPSALRGVLSATVLEPGGRGVTAYRGVIVHPHRAYVGIRGQEEGYAARDTPKAFEYVVVNPEGEPLAGRQVEVTLHREYYHSILKEVDGRFRYVSEQVEDLESRTTSTSGDGASTVTVTPDQYGRYRLTIKDLDTGTTSGLYFYSSGWGYVPWAMDTPERIELDLDKAVYQPGDRARLQVRAPFPGKLLMTIERDEVFEHVILDMPENTASIDFEVKDVFQPNAYVSAHLIRSTESLERDTPVRAFGVIPLMVDNSDSRLAVTLNAPDEMRPQNPLTVDFHIDGAEGGRPYVTIAAVDEGILQLTDFQSPDPHAHFFSKKRLGVETSDIYGVLLPEIAPTFSSPAGDVEAARMHQLSPATARRVKPVAFWSGLVETDGQGNGSVTFDMPQFNGTVRLMAVAFSGGKFGHAEQDVLVRDPVVMTPTFPRFLASTDEFLVPVSVFNGTGSEASFEVTLEADGPVEILGDARQSVRVAQDREGQLYFKVRTDRALGQADFRLHAAGGGQETSYSVEVPIRPPVPFTTLADNGSLTESATATFTWPADFLEGTTEFNLSVASFPALEFAGGLQFLLSYPHGCLEQTTSKVFPLLAFTDLSRLAAPELFETNSADYYIAQGITKIESMQNTAGTFSYWPDGGYSNTWSSVYASHFLVEARRAGYEVADRVYDRMLDALRSLAREYRGSESYGYQPVAYATYVLALAGKPDRSTMNFLRNNALDKLDTYSQYQLAGAFGLAGDRTAAQALLPNNVTVTARERETGGHFNSETRARAIMLDVLAEIDPSNPNIPTLVQALTDSYRDQQHWGNTQENAYAFLGLGKVLRSQEAPNFTGTVRVGDQVVGTFDETGLALVGDAWTGQDVTISIAGAGTCYYYWKAEGIPSTLNVPEYDNDLVVRRRYLHENGSPIVDLSQVQQGELIVAELTIRAPTRDVENIAIIDMLPAGFEIENPRLQSRRGVEWIGEDVYEPDYFDIRDDRMLVYGDAVRGQTRRFYYGLRAVTAGTFRLPPVRAEAMYVPSIASVASSGLVIIQPLSNEPPTP